MEIYYTGLSSMIPGQLPDGLENALWNAHTEYSGINASGTDSMSLVISDILFSETLLEEGRWGYTMMSLPLIYIGLVYLCAALTILSVQQLSDSGKYRFHCRLLSSLGLRRRQINMTVLRQMFFFYLCPGYPRCTDKRNDRLDRERKVSGYNRFKRHLFPLFRPLFCFIYRDISALLRCSLCRVCERYMEGMKRSVIREKMPGRRFFSISDYAPFYPYNPSVTNRCVF